MNGLLALAVGRNTGRWHLAGGGQSEYQAWLAGDGFGDRFIDTALRCLRNVHGLSSLCFEYLPPGVPLTWTGYKPWRWLCSAEPRSRPLMSVEDPARLAAILKKKGNRSRYSRLKRKGDLRLVEFKSGSDLAARLPGIETLYDLRICSLHGLAPFHDDPHKREFHLALMDVPRLLHASALLRDDCILAAHIGVREHDLLYNGISCYSPFEARNSPGKILILLLAQTLSASGFRCFDLTPGLDLWKENFATHHNTVTRLSIHANFFECGAARLRSRLRAWAVKALRRLELEPRHVFTWIRNNVTERLKPGQRRLTYRLDIGVGRSFGQNEVHSRDRLEDLFAFDTGHASQRQRFVRSAMAAITRGRHIYTLVRNGRLIHYGWLDPAAGQDKGFAVVGGFEAPAGAVLSDGDILAGLELMCRDAASLKNVDYIYARVNVTDPAHRQALEKIGFRRSQLPAS